MWKGMTIPPLGVLIIALAAGAAGLQPAAPVYYRDLVAVLTYHDVAQRVPRGTDTVSPDGFSEQMALLGRDGFAFVSVPQLEQFLSEGARVPPNAVCVVFDNGYEGIYRYAMPVLRRDGIPAAVFLIVSHVGHLATDFTWPQIQEMSHTGLVRFYTETYDLHRGIAIGRGSSVAATVGHGLLPDGSQESNAAYRARVLADLVRARTTVERETGQPVNALVYPYGQYTPELIDIAHAAGNAYMFTTQGWMVGPHTDPSRLPRLDIGVWDETPQGVVGAILTVAAVARRAPYTPPASYVRVWR